MVIATLLSKNHTLFGGETMIDWFLTYPIPLLQGLLLTLELTALGLLFGLAVAVLFASILQSHWRFLHYPIHAFTFFIRGTPLLVQIFLIYFGLSQFAWIREQDWLWIWLQEPFICAVLALGLNSAAYTTVLLQGTFKTVPVGEIEAAKALGLSSLQILRRIILPRATITAWSAYSNEVVLILKSTALVSTITLLDLMGAIRQITAETYEMGTGLLIAGLVYGSLTAITVYLFRSVEKRFPPIHRR